MKILFAKNLSVFCKLKIKDLHSFCSTTFLFLLSVFVIFTLFDRIRLSIILLDQGANAVFSVLSTLFWSPFIIILFFLF